MNTLSGLIHVLSKVPLNALGVFYLKILFMTRIVHQSHDHHLPGHMTAIDKHNHMAIDQLQSITINTAIKCEIRHNYSQSRPGTATIGMEHHPSILT